MGLNFHALAIAGLSLVAAPMPSLAQQVECPAEAPALPPELSGWMARTPLAAAMGKASLGAARLEIGKGVDATLKATPEIDYVVRPEKPGGSVSYGGLFSLTIREAGTYRIALGTAAWIDVLAARTVIASTGHGHGPACSGVRKMVDFPLQPGAYVIQIAANGAPTLPMMVTKLP